MAKSFVTLEIKRCIVCGKDYDSGAILIDRRLHDRFEMHTCTGFGDPCNDCTEHLLGGEHGRIALVGIDETKSEIASASSTVQQQDVYRTGKISFLDKWAWQYIFDIPMPRGPLAFLSDETIALVEERVGQLVEAVNKQREENEADGDG